MPCRDAAATVAEAVRSIRAQTRCDWELLVVDDGSRDDTRDVVLAAADGDARIRLLTRGREGLVAALNHGIAQARAPWIARMDADDVSLPLRLERQLDWVATHPGLAGVGSLVQVTPPDALTDGMRHYIEWLNRVVTARDVYRDLYVESPFAHPSVLLHRASVVAVGCYRDGLFPEDYDLWLRLHGAGGRMEKVPEVLLQWREGPSRLSRTDPRYAPEAFRALKAHHLARTFLKEAGEAQIWGAGPDGRRFGRALAVEGIAVRRFFDVDPRKVGRVLGGGSPVLDWREVGAWRGCPLLVAVGVKGARALIRANLEPLGWQETVDFRCVQ
jgi:glycosyltransferase involved in cell wall biosynthesis